MFTACGIKHSLVLCEKKYSAQLPAGNGTENVRFRRIPRCAQLRHVGFQFAICIHWPIHLPMEVNRSFVGENKLCQRNRPQIDKKNSP